MISKSMRIETILDQFEREKKNREVMRILAGDPALSDEDFKTEEALDQGGQRTANGPRGGPGWRQHRDGPGAWTLQDDVRINEKQSGSESLCIDRDVLKPPKFSEMRWPSWVRCASWASRPTMWDLDEGTSGSPREGPGDHRQHACLGRLRGHAPGKRVLPSSATRVWVK